MAYTNFSFIKLKKQTLRWIRTSSVPHSGFGLGFERAMMYLTGMQNIRDVIPFPRTLNNCEF